MCPWVYRWNSSRFLCERANEGWRQPFSLLANVRVVDGMSGRRLRRTLFQGGSPDSEVKRHASSQAPQARETENSVVRTAFTSRLEIQDRVYYAIYLRERPGALGRRVRIRRCRCEIFATECPPPERLPQRATRVAFWPPRRSC